MRFWTVIIFTAAIFAACRKPYYPPETTVSYNYLVVEGAITSGADSTVIRLSRTVKLSAQTTLNPELNAVVTVEDDQNSSFPVRETGNGYYRSPGLTLNNARKYRLRINTSNGGQYLSDFITVLNSPPIDSVNYTTNDKGLNVLVSTHDPKNATRYYRWDYTETWRFESAFQSHYKSNGDTVLPRDIVNDQIYTCWRSDTSSAVIIANSSKLANDVIYQAPVAFVGSTTEQLGKEYSILVRQYALTSAAYTFWQNLQKNTQQLGSIFDALPSQINGNMHCVNNPSEPVIGYMTVGGITSSRLFVFAQKLPAWLPIYPTYDTCTVEFCLYKYYAKGSLAPVNTVDEFINYNKTTSSTILIPIDAIPPAPGSGAPPIGYSASEPICVDCRLRGTNVQPSYWRYQ